MWRELGRCAKLRVRLRSIPTRVGLAELALEQQTIIHVCQYHSQVISEFGSISEIQYPGAQAFQITPCYLLNSSLTSPLPSQPTPHIPIMSTPTPSHPYTTPSLSPLTRITSKLIPPPPSLASIPTPALQVTSFVNSHMLWTTGSGTDPFADGSAMVGLGGGGVGDYEGTGRGEEPKKAEEAVMGGCVARD